MTAEAQSAHCLVSGSRTMVLEWPGVWVEYAWLPPYEGHSVGQPNRLKAVFSPHSTVAMELGEKVHEIRAPAGTIYAVGEQPTALLRVGEYSDTLNIHPDIGLLRAAAEMHRIADFEIEPTLRSQRAVTLERDAGVLGAAHLFRRACVGKLVISDIEASALSYQIAQRLLVLQYGIEPSASLRRDKGLCKHVLRTVCDYIEAKLGSRLTLDDLARLAGLSPFHFVRCFKTSTGLPPHKYVLARRMELAKSLLVTTTQPVQEIAWSVGYENISHFRRKFRAEIGLSPGELRKAIQN